MKGLHLWRGDWIDDAELEARLPLLYNEATEALTKGLSINTVMEATNAFNRHLKSRDDLYSRIVQKALSTT